VWSIATPKPRTRVAIPWFAEARLCAENFEWELRHGVIPKKAGVVRVLAFTNHANLGVYREAVAQFEEGFVTYWTSPIIPSTSHTSTDSAQTWSRVSQRI
jgi:hypothetical protein